MTLQIHLQIVGSLLLFPGTKPRADESLLQMGNGAGGGYRCSHVRSSTFIRFSSH